MFDTEYDGSGYVFLNYYEVMSCYGEHNTVTAYVDPSEVLVGGGGYTYWCGQGAGAFLTGSYPVHDATGEGWTVQSKDHGVVCKHYTYALAVGMRLLDSNGKQIDKSVIEKNMMFVSSTSAYAQHPSATAYVPTSYQLLGGGARVMYPFGEDGVNRYGNLLYSSKSVAGVVGNANGAWYAASKDQGYASPAMITAYAICLDNSRPIPGFGYLSVKIESPNYQWTSAQTQSYLVSNLGQNMDAAYRIIGAAANAGYNSYGRLFTALEFYPEWNIGNAIEEDLDCLYPDSGYSQVQGIWLAKDTTR